MELVLKAPGFLFLLQAILNAIHLYKSASWFCSFSKITCDFVRARVGTCHEIPFTAAGSDLWGSCCQSLSLSCCVCCAIASPQLHTQTPAGQGEEWEEGGGVRNPRQEVSNSKTKWPHHYHRKETFWTVFNITEQYISF